MTIARKAMTVLDDTIRLSLSPRRVAQMERKTEKATRRLALQLGAGPMRPPTDRLLDVADRLREAAAARDFARIASRDWRLAPWVFWSEPGPVIGLSGVVRAFEPHMAASRRVVTTAIEAYLRDFALSRARLRDVGQMIGARLGDGSRLERWRAAQDEFGLFDPARGPKALASACLEAVEGPDAVLARATLDDERRSRSGFMRATEQFVLERLDEAIRASRGLDFVERGLATLTVNGTLRFPASAAETAYNLLRPWLSRRGAEPGPEYRDRILGFLVEHLKDPRLHPQRWSLPGERGERMLGLVRQWLNKITMEQFFQIIGQYAVVHQWQYREAFWRACLHLNLIDEAWLALGPTVATEARISLRGGEFGRLDGAGATKAALVMRLGPLVMVEMSDNGKLRAWRADWDVAPRLNQEAYHRNELMRRGLPFPVFTDGAGLSHTGSASGLWQERAAKVIADHCAGRRPQPEDWEPR